MFKPYAKNQTSLCYELIRHIYFTSLNPAGITPTKIVWKGILFFNFCNKEALIKKMLFGRIRFIMQKK